ncbi:MAG: CPBP family intramembrane metalloprotease [Lachnospiraceae bacterium]|nr:CPBP family intramembrane metalloprotease [Lachnospiraceae bacterium]
MKMEMSSQKPEAVILASEKKKGMNWFIEILVFLIVFLVVGIGQILFQILGELLLISRNADYQAAAAQIGGTDIFAVLSLFTNIAMILIVFAFCKLIQKRNPVTLGFTRKGAIKDYLIGLAAGFLVFSAAVLICVLTGALKLDGFAENFGIGMFVLFVLGFMIQGMAEEVLCRGYFMVSVGRRNPMWAAVLLNALVFAAMHLLNSGISVLAFVNLVLYGLFASIYFIKGGNIWGVGAFHSMWNLVQGNVYGILVSGMSVDCTVLKSTAVEGMEIVNGGAFGLEGGLAVTVVLLLGIGFLLWRKGSNQKK